MSAIEVLKKMINEKKPYECYMDDKIKLNALKEALLALEQKENLKFWVKIKMIGSRWTQDEVTEYITEYKILKEVLGFLELVGEQK